VATSLRRSGWYTFLVMLLASPWLDDLVPANGNILMLCEVALPFLSFFFTLEIMELLCFLKL